MIPAGEYGGGDVIVWDAGTWEPGEPDPAAAVAAGELHAELHGSKLRGRFVLVRTGRDSAGKEQWLLLHKHDEFAVGGWDPEDHPRSVLSGRANDEVLADPDRMWRSDLPAGEASIALRKPRETGTGRPSPAELAALEELPSSGQWQIFGRELKVTNHDKALFPGSADHQPITKRDFLRHTAQIAPITLPYLAGRALNMHRYPHGAGDKGFWHKELPGHAPGWLPRWQNPEADESESRTYLVVNEPAALVWAANFGALEWHAWTSLTDRPRQPTYALIGIDPGGSTSWQDVLVLARLDYTQNAINKTLVAPYSARPAPGAPVSMPISWDELDDPGLRPDGFAMRDVPRRIVERGDLFQPLLDADQRLPALG